MTGRRHAGRGHDGRLYESPVDDGAVRARDLPARDAKVVVRDARLRWPDTFAEAPDGTIYLTTSYIQDSAFYKRGAPIALPTELWSFKP